MNRGVDGGVGQVKEKRPAFVLVDELYSLVRVSLSEAILPPGIDLFNDALIPHQGKRGLPVWVRFVFSGGDGLCRSHVVGIRQAKVMIEAVARGQEYRIIANMPFPDDHARIAARF